MGAPRSGLMCGRLWGYWNEGGSRLSDTCAANITISSTGRYSNSFAIRTTLFNERTHYLWAIINLFLTKIIIGLGVTCSPRDPRFAGSNPAEVDGFFSGRKNPEHKSSGRDFRPWVWDHKVVTKPNVWKNRLLGKIYLAYSRPSNTLVPI